MVPIVLRTFIKFYKNKNNSDKQKEELILNLLGNTLHLTYIYLNEIFVNNAFIIPYKISAELFEVQRILAQHIWQHNIGVFTRNNHYYTHIVDPLYMSSESFVDCCHEYNKDYINNIAMNNNLQLIYECMSGIFAFILYPPNNIMTQQQQSNNNIDIDDTLYYTKKEYNISEFLNTLIYEPQLFNINLITLHQCLIHVNVLVLKQYWIKKLNENNIQIKLKLCMKHLALSSDFYIHQILPCVYIQLSQLDINIAKCILNPFIEMIFSQFLSTPNNRLSESDITNISIPSSKWQLIRLCKCLSWMLRDAWSISLIAPNILSKYINNTNYKHKIDTTPINLLLQQINKSTLQQINNNTNPLGLKIIIIDSLI